MVLARDEHDLVPHAHVVALVDDLVSLEQGKGPLGIGLVRRERERSLRVAHDASHDSALAVHEDGAPGERVALGSRARTR
jgi:hypothetical protein